MDDYSKSGPRSPKAEASQRQQEQLRLMRDLLALEDEADLREELEVRFKIGKTDTRYKAIINAWREKRS